MMSTIFQDYFKITAKLRPPQVIQFSMVPNLQEQSSMLFRRTGIYKDKVSTEDDAEENALRHLRKNNMPFLL